MKYKWWTISLFIIIILSQTSSTISIVIPTLKDNDDMQEKFYKEYENNWYLQTKNLKNIEFQNTLTFASKDIHLYEKNQIMFESFSRSTDGVMNCSWPMCLHDIHHTAQSQYSTANNTGVEKWRFRTIGDGDIESGAVIDKNGTIYFGSLGSDRRLTALNQNGTLKWAYQTGGLVWSDPAITENGTIYFGSWDDYLYGMYPNGAVKWRFNAGTDLASSPAIADDGTIYFGGFNGYIYAVNPNGTKRWWYPTGNHIVSDPAIGNDGTVYIGSGDYYVYALYPNGTFRWRFGTAADIKGSPSIAPDGTIYVPSFDGYLYALYPNGTMKWRASTGNSVAARSAAIASDGTLYVGTEILRAFYPNNGTLKWICDVGGDVYGCSPAISSDGTIYVSAGASLVAVSPDGTVRWKKQITDVHARSSPCIGEDGTVYVGSTNGVNEWYGILHAFGSGEPKKIEIQQPEPGRLYLFSLDMGRTLLGNTVIIGSVKVKVQVYSEDQIESVHFYVDGTDQYNVTKPPYEWNMNHRYGKLFPLKHTITVTGFYKGGCSWSESIDVMYFHFF
jgi:outer membrane protein assembly factor BamB